MIHHFFVFVKENDESILCIPQGKRSLNTSYFLRKMIHHFFVFVKENGESILCIPQGKRSLNTSYF